MTKTKLLWHAKQVGIYCIRNARNGKVYIGSSVNCYHRVKSQHFARLRSGKHSNPHLQSAWNRYGEQSFESFVVELCDESQLLNREQFWIDENNCRDSRYGYNCVRADRKEHTDKQKQRISAAAFGKSRRKGVPSGITRVKKRTGQAWMVCLFYRLKEYYLGYFDSYRNAVVVRSEAVRRIRQGMEPDWDKIDLLRLKPHKRREHVCGYCGLPFETKQSRKKYCSDACFRAFMAKRLGRQILRKCEVCGKSYSIKPSLSQSSKFCSNPCKYAGRKNDS